MRILVLGYYGHGNCGDEAYLSALPLLFPGDTLDFQCSSRPVDTTGYDVVLFGPGDVFTTYFINSFLPVLRTFTGPKIAISVGFSILSMMRHEAVGLFDHVYTRGLDDSRRIQKILGTYRGHYLPDAVFALPPPVKAVEDVCFFSLTRSVNIFEFVMEPLKHLVQYALDKYAKVIFLRFDTSDTNDDNLINTDVRNRLLAIDSNLESRLILDQGSSGGGDYLQVIANCKFGVCMHFHAHVFSMIAGTPFVSISTTRRTRKLMEDSGMTQFQYCCGLDSSGTPVSCNYNGILAAAKMSRRSLNSFEAEKHRELLLKASPQRLIQDMLRSDLSQEIGQLQSEDLVMAAKIACYRKVGSLESKHVYGLIKRLQSVDTTEALNFLIPDSEDVATIRNLNFNFHLTEYHHFARFYRRGWGEAVSFLSQYRSAGGVLFDLCVDATFHWNLKEKRYLGIIPYTTPWMGVVHHPPQGEHNSTDLVGNEDFLLSLSSCCGLFALSQNVVDFLRIHLDKYGVRVSLLYHPMEKLTKTFDPTMFNGMVVQIGAWLRDPSAIYTLRTERYQKVHLKGIHMNSYFPTAEEETEGEEEEEEEVRDLIKSVTVLKHLDSDGYDQLLSTCIVYIQLIDASAVNTVLECLCCNTPIVVNPLPAVVEILGIGYPLYYEQWQDFDKLVTPKAVLEAHRYLKDRSKDVYRYVHFLKSLVRSPVYNGA